LYLYTSRWVIS